MKLDAAFLENLSRLRLAMGHKTTMNLSGNRKSLQKGSSTEFSDFREYIPGDDLRRIDWNAYGRLDRLYVKEYMEEKEAVIHILIDTSASMDFGERPKSEIAVQLAAAMAYLGINNLDRVILHDAARMSAPFAAGGGKKALPAMLHFLEQCEFGGEVDLAEAVRQITFNGPGVTILISDFLQENLLNGGEALKRMLGLLQYRRQQTVLLQVLAREELSVALAGTYNLIDAETNASLCLTLDARSINRYEEALREFCEMLKRECAAVGAIHVLCDTGKDLQQLVFSDLRILYDI